MKTLFVSCITLMLCSCSFSYNQSYSYDTKKRKAVKIKGCRQKIQHPRPETILGH